MTTPIRLCLALHNHQPVGNFDFVFEQAYQQSYLPFLNAFEPFTRLRISLHTSGPLMEWLEERHPEYLDRLAGLVEEGRVEILGGPFYEPILSMIPPVDRVGQITQFTRWLENRLGGEVRGMWMPERVWEQSLTSDIVQAGIQYTILDDYHFKSAGLPGEQLDGYYLTEDNGNVLGIFPGSEQLRYLIPFHQPQESIDLLRQVAERRPGAVLVFGDDGEKFGTWPDTYAHVYERGWLRSFFEALDANRDWINTSTLSEAFRETSAVGKVYLPDGSYREMTEWAFPVDRQQDFDHVVHGFEHDDRWPLVRTLIRGGYWRNFKVKYPETNEMYSRMMAVSRRLQKMLNEGVRGELIELARRELYRGQCNCSYWHGAFGGTYLPHLRHAVYNHLIAADNLMDRAIERPAGWLEATATDFNFDARSEVLLANERLQCFIAPHVGGHIYELDVRSICLNLLATLNRRPESYHEKVLAGGQQHHGEAASIHERVVFKQEGLDQHLQYDRGPRKSLIDHFYDPQITLEQLAAGNVEDLGDFAQQPYDARIRRKPDRIQVQLMRDGKVDDQQIRITKGVTLEASSSVLEISYLLEGLNPHDQLRFGVELNFAGLPAGADDRFFFQGDPQNRLGQLGKCLSIEDGFDLGLADQWQGIRLQLSANRPTGFWTFPIETVSQSEGGFELVHQSVVVHPHWLVQADAEGRWSVTMKLDVDTSWAESRLAESLTHHHQAGV
ncbi:MAG: alpha-amylase/4-alpha-glucanotransferase domain-containing protein [Pirellulales bacterium]